MLFNCRFHTETDAATREETAGRNKSRSRFGFCSRFYSRFGSTNDTVAFFDYLWALNVRVLAACGIRSWSYERRMQIRKGGVFSDLCGKAYRKISYACIFSRCIFQI